MIIKYWRCPKCKYTLIFDGELNTPFCDNIVMELHEIEMQTTDNLKYLANVNSNDYITQSSIDWAAHEINRLREIIKKLCGLSDNPIDKELFTLC